MYTSNLKKTNIYHQTLNTVQLIKNIILRLWSNKWEVSTSNGSNKKMPLFKKFSQKTGNFQFVSGNTKNFY